MQAAVECRSLVKTFRGRAGTVTAIDHLDLDVASGQLFGLLGPNGAGKTTLLRMLYGASPPTTGSIRVLGHDLPRDARRLKARLGIVPQENNLDPDFTVEKNLHVYARYFDVPAREARRRASELLAFVGLEEKAKEKIEALSGGMKRRLLLARGLLNRPDILLLDEPTTGLDPQARHLVWTKVRDLRRGGITILLTTHYMDEAERLCDELVIIDHGRILVRGSPRRLIEEHAATDVIELSFADDARTHDAALRRTLARHDARLEFVGERAILYLSKAEEALSELKARLPVQEALVRRATLEDVFLRLTGRALRE